MSTPAQSDPAEIAARHLNAGRFAAAQALYNDMLARNPSDPRAIGGLGAIALQSGDASRAMALFAEASRIAPRDAQTALNLGVAYQAQGKREEAELCFRRAVELDDTLPSAHGNLAALLAARGEREAAARSLARAIDLAPNSPEFRYNHANLMLSAGAHGAAIRGYEDALALDPDHVASRNNLALALKQTGDLKGAVHHLTEARMREPGHPEIQINLADTLSRLDRHEEAIALARNAATLSPANALLRSGYGVVLMNAGRLDEALRELSAAVKAAPRDPTAPLHMVSLLRRQDRLDAALTAAQRAAGLSERPGVAHLAEGEILLALGRFEEAWSAIDRVAAASPTDGILATPFDPASLSGQRLRVVVLEPSSLFFAARLLPDVARAGVAVEVICPPTLERIAACIPGVATVTARATIDLDALRRADEPLCLANDLPRLLRATPDDGPDYGDARPAIVLPDAAAERYRSRLEATTGPKVGLWWESGSGILDPNPLIEAVGGTPVILQIGAPRRALGDLRRPAIDLSDAIGDFHDLAAAISLLDGVVTVDGPVAHLAAAMGRRVWVLVGVDRPWVWRGPADRPWWYPSARPILQAPDGSWQSAVAALGAATSAAVEGARP